MSSPGGKGGDTRLGNNCGDTGLPNRQNPPIGFTNEIQRNANIIFGISSSAWAVEEMSNVTPNNFRRSIPVLLLGFAPFYQLPIKATECDLPFRYWVSSVYNTIVLSTAGSRAVLPQFKGKSRRHINRPYSRCQSLKPSLVFLNSASSEGDGTMMLRHRNVK